MIINIRIELSTEQLEELRKTGELAIKVATDEVVQEDRWPDSKGYEGIDWLIREAKYYGLEPGELPQLSMCRVMELFERHEQCTRPHHTNWEKRQARKNYFLECLRETGIHLFDGEDGPDMIKNIIGIRNANLLKHQEGLVTITDLKTTSMKEIRRISGLGKVNLPKVESELKKFVRE